MNYQEYRPNRFSILPEVVKNILIINGIFYLATVILEQRGINLTDMLGLHYFTSEKFRIWQFVTYMFMHGSLSHIFFNMFAVWMFGAAVENMWGGKKFLIYYLLTGFGAALCHYAIVAYELHPFINMMNDYISNPSLTGLQDIEQSGVFSLYFSPEMSEHNEAFVRDFNSMYNVSPAQALQFSTDYVEILKTDLLNAPLVVGASGAVFGLLLAYGMIFPDSIIYIYFALPIKAKYFVILYGAIELFSGIAAYDGDNVAHFAHLGGLFTGLIIILFWKYKQRNRFRY
jgi:membrane associated rhomboid family serine protease